MLVIDTNVLLRAALMDDAEQGQRARAVLVKAQHAEEPMFLPQVVVQELVWVLQSVKKIPRLEVLRLVDGLLSMPIWVIEAEQRMAKALQYYEQGNIDFTDACLAAISHEKGLKGVLSFDGDLGRTGTPWVRP